MRKLFVSIGLLALLLANPSLVTAQQGKIHLSSTGSFQIVDENVARVTLTDLGYQDLDLISPLDSTSVLFSIPPNWRLTEGASIELNYEVTLSGSDVGRIAEDQRPYGGVITVMFNRQLVGYIYLDQVGAQQKRFEIPPEALVSPRRDGRHELTLSLNAQFSCTYDIRTLVIFKASSFFELPFEVSPPELNLARLPAPFYVRDALLPDQTLIVVPNRPTAEELSAAMNVVAGFGSMTSREFVFSLVEEGDLSATDSLSSAHLVFVGKPERFSVLSDVSFPLPVEGGRFTGMLADAEDDGVVELALSPWNENKAVMLVGGLSDAAVLKASQAVSSGKIFVTDNPALVYVADVKTMSDAVPIVEDFTLQDLGYQNETLTGIGVDSVDYIFRIAKEQVATEKGYVDLVYYHSALLDYGNSSFTVLLNGEVIAGTALSAETANLTHLRVDLPKGLLRFGENRLTVRARLQPFFTCDTTGFSDPWLTISNQTALHIPKAEPSFLAKPAALDLKFYPNLVLTRSDLGEVAFVVPQEDAQSWRLAADLTFDLAQTANPLISNLVVVFGGDVPMEVRGERSLVVIGRASTLPLLTELNDRLPAPFDFETDTASERQMQIVYRIPPGVSVGYLELLASPYAEDKVILVVSGNTDPGVRMAGDALLVGDLRGQLAGVFAVTNGTQVATSDLTPAFSVVGEVVPGAEAVPTLLPPAGPAEKAELERPAWLLPLLIALSVLTVLVIFYVIFAAFLRRRHADEVAGE
ncbi:hypothetical protein D6833_03130 [Candidatus Parcubacteria bacterium]|nr:MAG: hypothetical protein D6833_03130 [Candidatus Parcubacteria bacterium]